VKSICMQFEWYAIFYKMDKVINGKLSPYGTINICFPDYPTIINLRFSSCCSSIRMGAVLSVPGNLNPTVDGTYHAYVHLGTVSLKFMF
jgi:hypothetical protein